MARGWESKAIESQVEDRARSRARSASEARKLAPLSPEDRARRDRRRGLELARTRILEDLKRSTVPAHRTMLQQALADVERQLAAPEP